MEKEDVINYLDEGIKARKSLSPDVVISTGLKISEAFKNGNKLILMGNGGSAADSQHIAAEFVGRFEKERNPLPALALNANSSSVTAISNDYSYEDVFSRQIQAFAHARDVVVGISTSGNSKNVVKALRTAREKGCYCISLTGTIGGKVAEFSNETINVQSVRTSLVQEVHIAIGHMWSKIVEDELFKS